MGESPERASLQILATTLQKALNALKKAMAQEHGPKRDKKINRIMAEVELVNDEAMRKGLNFSNGYIAKLKTGRISAQQITPPESNGNGGAHRELMKFHHDHITGPIGDAGAQAAVLKYLLERYAVEILKECYEALNGETWRDRFRGWLTVKSEIGQWMARGKRSVTTKADRSVEAAKQAAAEFRNGTGS